MKVTGARLNGHERGVTSLPLELDRYADFRGPASTLRSAAVGVSLSRSVRRLLARTRQPFLGRRLRGDRVPAAAWGIAAQGLVPDDRHCGRRRVRRGADLGVSTGSVRLSRAPRAV